MKETGILSVSTNGGQRSFFCMECGDDLTLFFEELYEKELGDRYDASEIMANVKHLESEGGEEKHEMIMAVKLAWMNRGKSPDHLISCKKCNSCLTIPKEWQFAKKLAILIEQLRLEPFN